MLRVRRTQSIDIEPFQVNVLDIEGIWYSWTVQPEHTPIGLHLARTARLLSRAFDDALAEAGGSLPVWLVLLNLKMRQDANQRQLAEGVGVSEATLTHHLNAMEKDGLLGRRRDPSNRRNHVVDLTAAGDAAFTRLAAVALAFDQRLRANLEATDLETLRGLLDQLCQNVGADQTDPPWAGLIERSADRPRGTRTPTDGPEGDAR
jgi:MarR family transcriptional regulator, transcriptional regulator for hemolysin